MEKKIQKRSLLKILLLTAIAFVMGLAVLFVGLNAAKRVNGAEENPPVATIHLGIGGPTDSKNNVYYYADPAQGWEEAVKRGKAAYFADSKSYVRVVLEADWTANPTSGFGLNTGYFNAGRLLTPDETNIELDLNGHKLNRNLQSSGALNGHVLMVSGNLTVTDSSANAGQITGGFNKGDGEESSNGVFGGGVFVNSGTFTLRGGTITGNVARGGSSSTPIYGVGVVVVNGGIFNMAGGTISGHKSTNIKTFGGAVCVYQDGQFNMSGGTITGNEAVYGGGVACYDMKSDATALTLSKGVISENKAISTIEESVLPGGGGICIYNHGSVSITGGEICRNTTSGNGAGIYVLGNDSASSFEMRGGRIHHNVAAAFSGAVNGGGVALLNQVKATVSGGSINNNAAIANGTNAAMGGGVYLMHSNLTLSDNGEINYNRAYSLKAQSSQEDLTAVVTGLLKDDTVAGVLNKIVAGDKTYGGGVAVCYDASENSNLVMKGGRIRGNKANFGAGIYADGSTELSGGSILENYANYGGGVYLTTNAAPMLSGTIVINENYALKDESLSAGEMKYQTNLEISGTTPIPVGKLQFGASIHVFMHEELIEKGTQFTTGYGENNRQFVSIDGKTADEESNPTNGYYVYENPYSYFVSDQGYAIKGNVVQDNLSEQHIMVLENGELGVSNKTVTFRVTYENTTTKDFTFGDASSATSSTWNYTSSTFGDANRPTKISVLGPASGEDVTVENAAKVYTMKAAQGSLAVEFSVVVKKQQIDPSKVTVELKDVGNLKYDGTPKRPSSVTVKLEGVTISADEYSIDYLNDVNAGVASVVITFTKNYMGTVTEGYEIQPSDSEGVTMSVAWQVKGDDGWTAITDTTKFTYDPLNKDQSGKVRATLTATGATLKQAVYAKGVTETDNEYPQNTSMYIEFKAANDAKAVAFENADTYTLTLKNESNYPIEPAARTTTLTMSPKELNITAADFATGAEDATRLWQLKIALSEKEEDISYVNLYDKANYIENGQSKKGTLDDAYARFRNLPLSLSLNNNFALKVMSEYTVRDVLSMAKLQCTNTLLDATGNPKKDSTGSPITAETVTGSSGTVTAVGTAMELTFSSNYRVGTTNNKIMLTKTWYIVTIVNELRMANGSTISNAELDGWQFGNMDGNLKEFTFRAEHGNTLIYTYYNSLGAPVQDAQFALIYNGDTKEATRAFYPVSMIRGQLVIDKNNPIEDDNYIYVVNNSLRADTYRLVITVLADAQYGEHTHWWTDGEKANDQGTVYSNFNYEFKFTVTPYAIAVNGTRNIGITYEIPNMVVEYTGTKNNVPAAVIKLNDRVLEEGVDYELYSDSVAVGYATLRVKGINSLAGTNAEFEISRAFRIVQGTNGWADVPSIMSWAYAGFDRLINRITATPTLPLDDPTGLWFAIARDSKGEDLIKGLDHIVLEDGEVPAAVATALNLLNAGQYYLVSVVEETANYRGLVPNAIPFRIFVATNSWETTPAVTSWTEGEYAADGKYIVSKATFGESHILIVDDNGTVYYDSDKGIDNLASAKAGRYTLTSYVDASDNYSELSTYTVVFQIFEKPGLPWWATLIAVVGALGIAALVIFILWKKGVFQILTEKIVVAIRTRASVEATIASVRAAKAMEEGRQSLADAKRRERIEKMRQRAKEQRALSPEERAAQLEAKAQAEAARAEKLRERSEANRVKAEKMRSKETARTEEGDAPKAEAETKTPAPETEAETKAPAPETAADTKVEATEKPETPTEE